MRLDGATKSETAYLWNLLIGNGLLFLFTIQARDSEFLTYILLHVICSFIALLIIKISHSILRIKSNVIIRVLLSFFIPPTVQFVSVIIWSAIEGSDKCIEIAAISLKFVPFYFPMLPLNYFILRTKWEPEWKSEWEPEWTSEWEPEWTSEWEYKG